MRVSKTGLLWLLIFSIAFWGLSTLETFAARTELLGTLVGQCDYDPYGRLIRETGPNAATCPFRYSTKYRDPDLDLYYYGHRWYDAAAMKWLTPDPVGERGGANLTAFCDGDPINQVDPLGLQLIIAGDVPSSATVSLGRFSVVAPFQYVLQLMLDEAAARAEVEQERWARQQEMTLPEGLRMEDLDSDEAQQEIQLAAVVVREKEISARRAELYEMVRRGASWWVVLDEMRVLEVETYRVQQMWRAVRYRGRPVRLFAIQAGDDPFFVCGMMNVMWGAAKLTARGAGALRTVLAASADEAARGLVESGRGLVHLTDNAAAEQIRATGQLRGNIYAGPAANAKLSGVLLTARTGLAPGKYEAIPIPAAGEAVFSKPTPIGPFTAWQRVTGQQCTPRGILDINTGAFVRQGVNWTQVGWYATDIALWTGGGVGLYLGTRGK